MSGKTEVRPARGKDLEAILALQEGSPEAPQWSEAIWRELLQSGAGPARAILVAENGGRVAGFVVARSVDGLVELESLVVAQAERRMGVGRGLCERVILWARQEAAGRVELEVRERNARARSFYRSLGFQEQGVRRGYYRAPVEDAVVMALTLTG